MTRRCGIHVTSTFVCAVIADEKAISWHGTEQIEGTTTTGEALASLLSRAPRTRFRRHARIVVSPAHAQLKRLDGLPPVKREAMLTRLIRENSSFFFLGTADSLLVSQVGRIGEEFFAAALDRRFVDAAVSAARANGLRVDWVAPAAAVTPALLASGCMTHCDGAHAEVTVDAGRMRAVRRVSHDSAPAALPLPDAVIALGADAMKFAVAYAAATSARVDFSILPAPSEGQTLVRARAQVIGAVAALGVAAICAVAAPMVRIRRFELAVASEVERLVPARREATQLQSELNRVSRDLATLQRFSGERGRITRVLGALSESLPDSTALVTLHVDSAGGTFIALAPHVTDVVPQLSLVAGLAGPRIVGAVAREAIGGTRLERASFRFGWTKAVADKALPLTMVHR